MKVGCGFNAPRVAGGVMTGYDIGQVYALMRAISRAGIDDSKAFRWQRCRSLVETLREHREEMNRRPKARG